MIDEQKAESKWDQKDLIEKFFFWQCMFVTIGLLSLTQVCLGSSGPTIYSMKFSFMKCLFVLPNQLPCLHLII